MDERVAVPCTTEKALLGEGCRWDGARDELLWVDVPAGHLFSARFHESRLVDTILYTVPGHVTAVAPLASSTRAWIVAANQGFVYLAADGTVTVLAEPEATSGGKVRMNDGCCDPVGRFWAGSMAYDESPGSGSLYRYDGDGQVTRVLSGVTISNGIGWAPDGRVMYYVDSGPGTLSTFDYDLEVGAATNRQPFVVFDPSEGVPDGMCVDSEGYLWVAIWGGGQVRRYTPGGVQIAVVHVDAPQPSCCALGGPDMRHLFVTTAREGLSDQTLAEHPDSGRVFVTEVDTPGLPASTCTDSQLVALADGGTSP
jgi:sugar lactone lactonase YvrE